ncbi:ankyrin repeat domain-containing protein [Geobacter benzoatilyticus]|uniref:Ankyrin repeat domain-containing protein n=1 Tax=Geobacter benzoatilyticus TaxID=2815309 RepID=A0ABX7PZY7_9BACT|nr:ankyrin repeat domain-containing protein [Geobacter benzoatilyticus]QSV44238.1 ankyrin repeat domain-containing protein [Geobacter benzoatilyticus]
MKTINMLAIAGAIIVFAFPSPAHCYEAAQDATTKRMMAMIVDLGGHDAVRKNSGKLVRCADGGTRKVSIVKRGTTTTYRGDYRTCREGDSVRDGIYEIVFNGDEIAGSTEKRSINGELFDAAKEGNAAKVRKLIKAKADVNYTESITLADGGSVERLSPLMAATMAGSLDAVKALVAGGGWVNYLNSKTVNSLWIAAHNGNLEIVKHLATHGAYLNNSNNEDVTPLMAAAMNGHFEVVKFLVDKKARIDEVHKEGDSALMFAVARGHTDIARFLIDAGANVNIRNAFGVTALIISAAEGNDEVARKLLEKNADTTVRTATGLTALDVARAREMHSVADLLEEQGKEQN